MANGSSATSPSLLKARSADLHGCHPGSPGRSIPSHWIQHAPAFCLGERQQKCLINYLRIFVKAVDGLNCCRMEQFRLLRRAIYGVPEGGQRNSGSSGTTSAQPQPQPHAKTQSAVTRDKRAERPDRACAAAPVACTAYGVAWQPRSSVSAVEGLGPRSCACSRTSQTRLDSRRDRLHQTLANVLRATSPALRVPDTRSGDIGMTVRDGPGR